MHFEPGGYCIVVYAQTTHLMNTIYVAWGTRLNGPLDANRDACLNSLHG